MTGGLAILSVSWEMFMAEDFPEGGYAE
jgi:hypothetical protein